MTQPTDGRDQTHALYRFWRGDTLLYVGITLDPGSRWRNHARTKPWWHAVDRVTVELHSTRDAVLIAERDAIIAERPLHNVVHNRGRKALPLPANIVPPSKITVGPYDDTENLWHFESRRHGNERTMPLYLHWQVEGTAISDNWTTHDIDAYDLIRRWLRGRKDPVQRIWWAVIPLWETAPKQVQSDLPEDFLSYYTWPRHPETGERINWLRPPVVDLAWNHEQADTGGFLQQLTGWKPAPLQPSIDTRWLLSAAGF